jgi:predicted amidohydrolase
MRINVATIQFEPTQFRKEENVTRLLALATQAARDGARLIVMPEMATTGYCWLDRAEVAPM